MVKVFMPGEGGALAWPGIARGWWLDQVLHRTPGAACRHGGTVPAKGWWPL
jgi:hypothetical protein